jgi:kynureninase
VHDSTTVGLFQLVDAAVGLQRRDVADRPVTIAVEETEFPTDRYVVAGIANRLRDVAVRHGLDDLIGVDVVVRSLVDYRTAAISPLAAETERAADAGAVTVWDLSHAAGVVAMDLEAAGVQLAAGCTYKFLNGGPGAPAFTYVRTAIQPEIVQPIWGWFGQRDQFAMDRPFDPRSGAARMLNGTPNILGLTAARAGISITGEAGIAAIAEKAALLAHHAIDLAERLELECTTARPPASSGGHVSIVHPDAVRLQAALADRRIVVDKRDPDVLRFGLSPLTTRYTDVFDAFTTLRDLI